MDGLPHDTLPDIILDEADLVIVAEATRALMPSMPISEYELDSERKSSPPVLERRKALTRFVASAVGVAWFICLVAVGQTALRAMFFH